MTKDTGCSSRIAAYPIFTQSRTLGEGVYPRAAFRCNPAALFVVLLGLIAPGCVLVPCPHRVYTNSHVSGRVIDDDTAMPIKGIHARIGSSNGCATTGKEGAFDICPAKQWRYIVLIPLVPVDLVPIMGDVLQLSDEDAARLTGKQLYESTTVRVRSYRVPWATIIFEPRSNLNLEERHEIAFPIRMRRFSGETAKAQKGQQ